ncbi:MAG: sulfatase-like hydrolase/transferase [Anaerolineae bacterium]|nr:sulfatase-like hydrolase/transferase [Anaerolineae bacterium]
MSNPSRPNVLVFFTDQQRWDTVGCYGDDLGLGLTPNLDRMATEGVRFELAFTAQPVCGPARACLQTGVYPTVTGCYRNGIPLPTDATTLAHRFRQAGYEVGYIGKWHLGGTRDQPVPAERRGGYSDFWLGADLLEFTSHPYGGGYFGGENQLVEFQGYRADSQTDHVIDYLRSRDGERPFFLFLSYLEPHHQNDMQRYVAPDGYAERYRDAPPPADLAAHPEGDWPANLADYYGICADLDENLGRVRAELERLGLAENTIILFTSDHGSHFRTRNAEYKRSCHEAAIRIPLVAWGGPFTGGRVVDELVSLIDVPPTLLDAADIAVPNGFHGRSLLPLARGEAVAWPQEVFVQISESQVGRALRTRRWKYGVDAPERHGWNDMDSPMYVEQYLYDLESDPHELHNLAGDPAYRAIADELAGRLVQRMVGVGERPPRIEPAG